MPDSPLFAAVSGVNYFFGPIVGSGLLYLGEENR
jgi:hypothetical protein